MKVCILGDVHLGVRSDSKTFTDHFRKYFTEIFFPYLVENNIKQVYQLGDLFDRRKYINFFTLSECRDYFFDAAKNYGIHLHILLGNHDIFWKETLSVNSPDLLLKGYDNITLYDNPTAVTIGKEAVDIIPWICNDNEHQVQEFISNTTSKTCLGHFEISGFQMYKGVDNHGGISPEIFKKYDLVLSGHFHHRSSSRNIVYVGTPMEHTWSDFEDPRGFHIFDTDTKELAFIENPYKLFHKIYYDDTKETDPELTNLKNTYCKVVIVNREDFLRFDKFMDRLEAVGPAEVKIIDDYSSIETPTTGDEEVDVRDTFSLLTNYVDDLETDVNKSRIKTLMKTLYTEAQESEN